MKRLLGQWFTRRLRPANTIGPAERPGDSPSSHGGCAVVRLNRELTELQGLLDQQLTAAQRAVGSVDAALEYAAEAWQEREGSRVRYYELLQGVLRVFDDCADLLAHDDVGRRAILPRFELLLAEHHVHRIPVEPGDRFQSELHHCEKLEGWPLHPPGCVVQVLQAGYVLQHPDGQRQVVRPAHVVVSKEIADESSQQHSS
jgi:molecular chaperone GrpE (heat shock protein)